MVDRVTGIFGTLETFPSDQDPEFEDIYGNLPVAADTWIQETRTIPYRSQGTWVPERMHSTMHALLAMHSSIGQNDWASLCYHFLRDWYTTCPFSATICKTPFLLMFGRLSRVPIAIMLGTPHEGSAADNEKLSKQTQESVQLAFELAHRNLNEMCTRASDQSE